MTGDLLKRLGDRALWKSTGRNTMYLMIFEDGEMKSVEEVGSDDLNAADSGCIDLVDITDPHNPTRYISGEWLAVEDLDD